MARHKFTAAHTRVCSLWGGVYARITTECGGSILLTHVPSLWDMVIAPAADVVYALRVVRGQDDE